MSLNSKQQAELQFWKDHLKSLGRNKFIEQRKHDFNTNTAGFQGKLDLSGRVLEVGSGLFSQLEWSIEGAITAVDPLMGEYKQLIRKYNLPQDSVELVTTKDENLPFKDNTFNYVVCWNVIDHTPDPRLLIDEMGRVMKPWGKLYLEVHFDDNLAPPHYALWTKDTVELYFKNWKKTFENEFRNPNYPQSCYFAIFEKGNA